MSKLCMQCGSDVDVVKRVDDGDCCERCFIQDENERRDRMRRALVEYIEIVYTYERTDPDIFAKYYYRDANNVVRFKEPEHTNETSR